MIDHKHLEKYFSIKNKENHDIIFINNNVNILKNKKSIETKNDHITFNFSSFSVFDANPTVPTVFVFVDNFCEISEKVLNSSGVFIIDHHLTEETSKYGNTSNAGQISDNYDLIYDSFLEYKEVFENSKIEILIHTDMDGLSSGFLIKKIILSVLNGKKDTQEIFKNSTQFIRAFGDYGDVSKDPISNVEMYEDDVYIKILDTKFKTIVKNFGRVFKAVKPSIGVSEFEKYELERYNTQLSSLGLNIKDLELIRNFIINEMNSISDINSLSFFVFFNSLSSNSIYNKVLDIVNTEITRITEHLYGEKSPLVDIIGISNVDKTKTQYKLIVIDSPFDIARNAVYVFKSKVEKNSLVSGNQYTYRLGDYKKIINLKSHVINVICYNKGIKKFTMMSSNMSALEIAKYFSGGGHGEDTASEGSIGSFTLENPEEFFREFRMVRLY